MKKLLFNLSLPLMKHIWLYYVLNYTWGILTTSIGWLIYLFIRVFFNKKIVEKSKFGPCYYLMFGNNWGGLELGTCFLLADKMGEYGTLHIKCHEMGHTFQNAILGPFVIFLITIPSIIRYWYRHFSKKTQPAYDVIWFEGSATEIGKYYYKNYLN